jgi:hypothetical protein
MLEIFLHEEDKYASNHVLPYKFEKGKRSTSSSYLGGGSGRGEKRAGGGDSLEHSRELETSEEGDFEGWQREWDEKVKEAQNEFKSTGVTFQGEMG